MNKTFDVIVVGGGHAGSEACLAASRMSQNTLLLTMNPAAIGLMPCNPAIGGLAKGQLVKEIDALGGEMGIAADLNAIQIRLLNTRKGPAVQSTRAQIDRHAYSSYIQSVIRKRSNLEVKEGMAEEILIKNGEVEGVKTSSGEIIYTKALILTPGTFLNGLIHIGLEHHPGGRAGERPSEKLSRSLNSLDFTMGRLKTGTCPRLDGRTINFDAMTAQYGNDSVPPFSFTNKRIAIDRQIPCYITYTNPKTHEIIKSNMNRSPLYTGIIKGAGVRYCPSIEDKISRFSDRDRHHIFVEPEGMNTIDFYPNGISTSLPRDVQDDIVRSIVGLEKAVITKYGYGIEYDFVDPTELYPTLETKKVTGLYLAGQINGTTGYEEAASLGLMAGINAALRAKGKKPLILERSQAYIGVLIDDLVTKGTAEPYRMFTSRVEYRLLIREDNADMRLTPIGHEIGLISDDRYKSMRVKKDNVAREISRLKEKNLDKNLRRPGISFNDIVKKEESILLSDEEIKEIEIEIKYEGFISRQLGEIARFEKIERIKAPPELNYNNIPGLSKEIKEKLTKLKPINLGQASRVSGVTPAAISILMIYLEKQRRSSPSKM